MRDAKILLSLALIGGIVEGCSEPTALPSAATNDGPSVLPSASSTFGLFDDAVGRIIPAMVDQNRAAALQRLLLQVSAAYEREDLITARQAALSARDLLSKLATSEHPANLSAIRLSLLQAETLLAEPQVQPPNQ